MQNFLRLCGFGATVLVAAFSSGAFAASNAVIDANAAAGVAATKACTRHSIIRSMSHMPTR